MENRNSSLSEQLRDTFKSQPNIDGIIKNVAMQIVPVVDVNPEHNRKTTVIRQSGSTGTAATTLYTTPTNQDFYLTEASLAYVKNAAFDGATSASLFSINLVIGGATTSVIKLPNITLTAGQDSVYLPISPPLKVDRGTNITISATSFTAGVLVKTGTVMGYLDEQSLA